MSSTPAFTQAAEIEATLERLAEVCDDPTPHVYARLFAAQPRMQAHFWRDTNHAVKGEMLSRTFEAILDFVGERRYAHNMIGTEMFAHEGYDIPREVFITFFGVIRDTVRELLGPDWTAASETAWAAMLAEIDGFGRAVPRSDTVSAYHAPRVAAFEESFVARAKAGAG